MHDYRNEVQLTLRIRFSSCAWNARVYVSRYIPRLYFPSESSSLIIELRVGKNIPVHHRVQLV